MTELVPGANQVLPTGALTVRVPGPFDVSALVTDDGGRVGGDTDFVFFNQPHAPGIGLRGDTLTLRPDALRLGASRVTVVVSPAEPGTPLGTLPAPVMSLTRGDGGLVAHFVPPRARLETVLLLAEIYRRGAHWKVRALGQGYADGLAGVARDFGVDVLDQAPPPPAPAPPSPAPAHRLPAAPLAPTGGPAPVPSGGAGPTGAALALVNAARSRVGARPLAPDSRLSGAATAHAEAMAAAGRLGVEAPAGVAVFHRVARSGYACLTIAEHLVSGPRTAAELVEYCQADAARAAPLRDPALAHAGVGRAVGAVSGEVYWTALWAAPFSADGLARLAGEVVALTNAERTAAGLRPLAVDARLTVAAQAHSADMVARDFYAHTTPEGREPWDRAAAAGCAHRGIGENIACGQRGAADVVRGWMNSPGHRANILAPGFDEIGVGYATGSRAGTYWTQLFGTTGRR
ncbi:CAP domain-containing protein [Streptomyces sp. NPDC057702]|uniref:CAP domain-containing protein n=1 Tax=unclassified Streptomyces TaxID=2593676 RepID=UPI0036C3DC2D